METYFEELPIAITISDTEGNILDMNQRSADVNSKGQKIIGRNLYDCHPPRAAEILRGLYAEQKKNVYTIEKNGVKKLIYQTPWYKDGAFAGLIEFSMEIPSEMPHYVRQNVVQ
ncbi:MAG: PAS domain-containing protein [Paludibacteraceae bacterium]|nr:PAS domain-containing protein [Paludibacteraceae bacterium]